jgi:hypothetical protein
MKRLCVTIVLLLILGCSGEEYYRTPELTLERYIGNRRMGSSMAIEATLNCFRRSDKEWWENKFLRICELKYGKFNTMCGESATNMSAIWNDLFEPMGPKSTNVTSSDIDEKEGLATLVVDGAEVYFIKEHNNWKLDGFFGVREQLEQEFPELASTE